MKVQISLKDKIDSKFEVEKEKLKSLVRLNKINKVEINIEGVIQKLNELKDSNKIHSFDVYQQAQMEAIENITKFEALEFKFQEEIAKLDFYYKVKKDKFEINFYSVDNTSSQSKDFYSQGCDDVKLKVSRKEEESKTFIHYSLLLLCKNKSSYN
jgi:hypothetical protein